MAVSTLGKVIKRGWDWLGLAPSDPARIRGLIEVPDLAESLTLNKADFIRTGPRGALYLAYRKGMQEAAAGPLAAWGAGGDVRGEEARRRKVRPLERDLTDILVGVADDFPLVASLIERRTGGQKRLSLGSAQGSGLSCTSSSLSASSSGSGGPTGSSTSIACCVRHHLPRASATSGCRSCSCCSTR